MNNHDIYHSTIHRGTVHCSAILMILTITKNASIEDNIFDYINVQAAADDFGAGDAVSSIFDEVFKGSGGTGSGHLFFVVVVIVYNCRRRNCSAAIETEQIFVSGQFQV